MHLITNGEVTNKTILLIDKDVKNSNDRTWCFWEEGQGLFQPIVYKEWQKLWFHSERLSRELQITPYTYKLIRGKDFYEFCFEKIKLYPNIIFKQAGVESLVSNKEETYIICEGKKIYARYIFNSILFQKPGLNSRQYWLLQHFKGWYIETKQACFQPDSATLMDFRAEQNRGTAFFYVLPFSATKALVEYTLFSPNLLAENEYDEALKNYIDQQRQIGSYSIYEEEAGSIPMTNYSFATHENKIINIGTAGGQTKGSSGYTFRFIQKHSAAIARSLAESGKPSFYSSSKNRFHFYDSILLHILHHRQLEGGEIFERLFTKNKTASVLKFLDNETSLTEDLGIIATLPTMPFLKAAIKQIGII